MERTGSILQVTNSERSKYYQCLMTHQQRLRVSHYTFSIITEILSISLCQRGRLQLKKVEDVIKVAHLGRGGDRPRQTRADATPGALSFKSVQFSRSVVSDSLRPHGLQHARIPSPSPTPGVRFKKKKKQKTHFFGPKG